MPFLDSILQSLGCSVFAKPIHGYGWRRHDATGASSHPDPPGPFHLNICKFYRDRNDIVGILGLIEEPGYEFDGLYAAFITRFEGYFDLKTVIKPHGAWISPEKPILDLSQYPFYDPRAMETSGYPQLAGWSWLAESREAVEEEEERRKEIVRMQMRRASGENDSGTLPK